MDKTTSADFSELEGLVRTSGHATFPLAGVPITLDLSNRHERAYAARLLLNVRHPQADIDQLLFRRFIHDADTVLDAGANIGVTALECLEAGARKVIAVEALPVLYERLSALSSPRVVPVKLAISASTGRTEFFVSTAHNQGSSLKQEMVEIFPTVFGEELQKVPVEMTTIDRLSAEFGAFDVWKLDIEGAETDAVRGARKTLSAYPPRVIIAELYDRFYGEFWSAIQATHPYAYRAFIPLDRYELELRPAVLGFPDGVQHTSPMYVFSRTPLSAA